MKGDKKRRKHGFKVGHDIHYKKTGHCNEAEVKKYLRLSKQEYDLVSKRGPGVDAASVGQGGNYRLLRPKVCQRSELELASETIDNR
jgi:hypothetical protein